jgi:hypothetical protein
MRVSNTLHQFYGGIDLPARAMYVCFLTQHGAMLGHRHQDWPETACAPMTRRRNDHESSANPRLRRPGSRGL